MQTEPTEENEAKARTTAIEENSGQQPDTEPAPAKQEKLSWKETTGIEETKSR